MPISIAQFCDSIGPELVALGIIDADTKWESICEKDGSHIIPKKRIQVLDSLDLNCSNVVRELLDNLQKNERHSSDFFNEGSEQLDAEKLQRSAHQIREKIGGCHLESAIRISMGEELFEITGKIQKNKSDAPDFLKGTQRFFGYIDAPSVWNKCVIVKSEDQRHCGRFYVQIVQILETLHQAQRDQALCEIHYENRLGANNHIERIITGLNIVTDEQQR